MYMETNCCCFCFGSGRKNSGKDSKPRIPSVHKRFSRERLLGFSGEEISKATHKAGKQAGKSPLNQYCPPYDDRSSLSENGAHNKRPFKELRGPKVLGCQTLKMVVKETHHALRSEDFDGNKMINEYVRQYKIGTGSYGKVVLHRSMRDHRLYAIKIFHKSRLCKLRVSPTETAMMDVLREVAIMKQLDHPNIVNLVEVIDDPESDHFYMVLEYIEGNWIFESSGPPGGLGEAVARRYFRDVVAGLMYLHGCNIIHGDIKPENLLISGDGRIKICDFGVSRMFEGENDELRRSPGTPVYTAPECCLGLTYHGKPADVWALGCTLYCMVLGRYPFVGTTLQSTYETIICDSLSIPEDMNPDLADLLRGLLCKADEVSQWGTLAALHYLHYEDARLRLTLEAVATHPWVIRGFGPVQQESHEGVLGQRAKSSSVPVIENGTADIDKMA